MGTRTYRLEWLLRTATRIATDATWVFIIVVVLSLISTAFSVRYMSSLQSDIADIYENEVRGQNYAQNAYITFMDFESTVKDFVIAESEEMRSAATTTIEKDLTSLQSSISKVTLTLKASRYRTLIANSKRDMAALADAVHSRLAIELLTQEQGRELLDDLKAIAEPLRNDIITMNDIKRSANRSGLRAVQIQLRLSLAATIGLLLFSIAIRYFLYRSSKGLLQKNDSRISNK